jgi:hypothetical protein
MKLINNMLSVAALAITRGLVMGAVPPDPSVMLDVNTTTPQQRDD